MSFDWYEEVSHTKPLTQGDIFLNFPVPVVTTRQEKYPFFSAGWTKKDVIVITQACDIEQGKAQVITFCPLVAVEEMIIELMIEDKKKSLDNQWYSDSKGEKEGILIFDFSKSNIKKKAQTKLDELRKGEFLNLHLLNESISTEHLKMKSKVVLLKDTYQVPIESANRLASNEEEFPYRLRLLPPYREHMAQAYSKVYMRIGLPQDINTRSLSVSFPDTIEFKYTPPEIET